MTEFDAAFDVERVSVSATFADRDKRLMAMTALMKETILGLHARDWETHAELWNIGLHINLAAQDLSVLVWQLCAERGIWARKLAGRHIALMLFETVEGLSRLLGGEIRQALQSLGVGERYKPDLRMIGKPLADFRKEHLAELKTIRNGVAAHRGHNGIAYLGQIEQLDIARLRDLGLQFSPIINAIGETLQGILVATSEIAPPQ